MSYKPLHTFVHPVGSRILVEPIINDKTAAGLHLPGAHHTKPTEGKVIAIGTPTEDKPINCKAGDKIFFNQNAGSEVVHMGNKCLLMWASDQIAVIEYFEAKVIEKTDGEETK